MNSEGGLNNFDGWQQDSNGVWWNMDGSGEFYNPEDKAMRSPMEQGFTIHPYRHPDSTPIHDVNKNIPGPDLSYEFSRIGRIPSGAIVLGTAHDRERLPVLLNLHDPVPGPILVVGEPGSGKTTFLKNAAASIIYHHEPEDVKFSVITPHPMDFVDIHHAESPHAQPGIFSVSDGASEPLLENLAYWVHGLIRNRAYQNEVNVLFLDNLAEIVQALPNSRKFLRYIFENGPKVRVWPIISASTEGIFHISEYLETFRTRVYGSIHSQQISRWLDCSEGRTDTLHSGSEFIMREGGGWTRFSTHPVDDAALYYHEPQTVQWSQQQWAHFDTFANADAFKKRHPNAGKRRPRFRR